MVILGCAAKVRQMRRSQSQGKTSSHCSTTTHSLTIEKSRAFCPGGRFHPSFIHQVIIITGLNKLNTTICSRPVDADRT